MAGWDSEEAGDAPRARSAGGRHARCTPTDRFGNRITGASAVKISGDDDAIRLRILAEKQYYKVGDEAKLQADLGDDVDHALQLLR